MAYLLYGNGACGSYLNNLTQVSSYQYPKITAEQVFVTEEHH